MAELTDTQGGGSERLSDAERARLDFAIAGRAGCPTVAIPDAVERIVREHVTAALDEIERRIEAASWFTFDDEDVSPDEEFVRRAEALRIVRGYRQEQDR